MMSDIIAHVESTGNQERADLFLAQVHPTFAQIKEKIDQLLRMMLDSVHSALLGLLFDLVAAKFNADTADLLFGFLNFQLAPFADTLYPAVIFLSFFFPLFSSFSPFFLFNSHCHFYS